MDLYFKPKFQLFESTFVKTCPAPKMLYVSIVLGHAIIMCKTSRLWQNLFRRSFHIIVTDIPLLIGGVAHPLGLRLWPEDSTQSALIKNDGKVYSLSKQC